MPGGFADGSAPAAHVMMEVPPGAGGEAGPGGEYGTVEAKDVRTQGDQRRRNAAMRKPGAIKSIFRAATSSIGYSRNGSMNGHKPYRYSAFDLLRHGFSQADWPRAWREHEMKSSYDVVVVGGGVHGLAAAYYL